MQGERSSAADQRWAALSLVADHLRPVLTGRRGAPAAGLDQTMIAPASHHLVSPAVGYGLNDADAGHPLHDYFTATLTLNRTRNDAILAGLSLLLPAFARAGIVPIAMKGAAALLLGIYPDRGVRILGDIDLLVDTAQIPSAIAAAKSAGFAAVPGDRAIAGHHHVPMMVHPLLGTGVELHHRPLMTTRIVTSEGFVRHAVPHMFDGLSVLLPGATDMVAHLVAHSQVTDANHRRATVPLRYLLELALIVERFGDAIDWSELTERFARARRTEVLALTCAASDHVFGSRTPFAQRSAEAAAWLRRGLGQSIVRRWRVELIHRLRVLPPLVRYEPGRLLNAVRPSRWRSFLRPLPEQW